MVLVFCFINIEGLICFQGFGGDVCAYNVQSFSLIFGHRLRCRAKTERSAVRPMGNTLHDSVSQGNTLTARTLVLGFVCAALQCWWFLEQPKGSLMEMHPLFQQFLTHVDVYKLFLRMRDFAHGCEKPTWLYSSPCFKAWRMCFFLLMDIII